ARATLLQHIFEKLADELQRVILEGERRAVKQLLEPEAVAKWFQRRDLGIVEIGIRLGDHLLPLLGRDDAVEEVRRDAQRDLGIGLAAQRRQIGGRKLWPLGRQIEPAIMCEPVAQHRVEGDAFGWLTAVAGTEIGQRLYPEATGSKQKSLV